MCFGTKQRRDSLDVTLSGSLRSTLYGDSVIPLQRPAPMRDAHSSRISSSSQNVDSYQRFLREPLSSSPSTPNGQSKGVSRSNVSTNPTMNNRNSSAIRPRSSVDPSPALAGTLGSKAGPSRRASSTNMNPSPPATPQRLPAVVPENPNNPFRKSVLGLDDKPDRSRVSSSIPNQTHTNKNLPARPQQLPADPPRNPNNPFRKPVPGRINSPYGSTASDSNPTQTQNVSSLNTTTNPPARQQRLSAASASRVASLFDEPVPARSIRTKTSSPNIRPKQPVSQAQASSTLVPDNDEPNTKTVPGGSTKQLVTERQTASIPPATVTGGRESSGFWEPPRTSSNMTASNSAATAASRTKALTRRNSPPPTRSHKPTASKFSSVAEPDTSDISSVSSASLDSLDKGLIKKLALKRARKQLLRSLSGRRDSNSSSSSSGVDPDIVLFALRRDAKNKAKQAKRNAEKLEDRRRGQRRTGLLSGQDGAKGKPQPKAENTELSRPKSSSNTTQTPTASESGTMKGSFSDFLKWKKQEAAKESLRGVLGMGSMPALRPVTFAEFCKEKQASDGDSDDSPRPKSSSSPASVRAGGTTITASSKEPAPVSAKKGPKLLVPPLKPATTAEEKGASLSKDTSKVGAMRPPTTFREALEARRKVREQERAREREEAEERAQADEATSQPEPGGLLGALRRARLEREEAEKARTAGAGGIAGEARKSSTPALTEKKGPKLTVPVLAGHATSSPKPATSTPTPAPKTNSAPGPRSSRAVAKWPESTYKHVHVRGPDAPGAVSLAEVDQQRRAVARWRRDGTNAMVWQGVLAQWWSKHGTWTARETQIIDAIRRTVEVM